MAIMEVKNVSYQYKNDRIKTIFRNANVSFEQGKFYAIIGNSGSGKTTFLSLLAGLDAPKEGEILFDGEDISKKGYANHRRDHICLVFQNYNLIDYMTPLENIRLLNKKASKQILMDLGLEEEELKRNVLKLSGGQQQRVAIGRALAADNPVILADEPTGNLDEKTADGIVRILKDAAHKENKCVIVVTHSKRLAAQADEVYEIKGKEIRRIARA